jgi:hypothetical protein
MSLLAAPPAISAVLAALSGDGVVIFLNSRLHVAFRCSQPG